LKQGQASRTAEYMALFRALEETRPASRRLFSDPQARDFLSPALKIAVHLSRLPPAGELVRGIIDHRWPGVRSSAVARTAYIDARLSRAAERGIRQVVILGAGFDSRPYRMPCCRECDVFEVDHPDTQERKRRLLREAMTAVPAKVRFVAVDFGRDRLADKLAEAGFDRAKPTFFLWEGVTNYLSAEAVDVTLRYCASAAPGSEILFTYIHQQVLDDPRSFYGTASVVRKLAAEGEQWTFGLDPSRLEPYLAERGLALREDAGAAQYRAAHYGAAAAIRMRGYEFYRIALAVVPAS
jgi:methyltransferase (TIGR00027 family)